MKMIFVNSDVENRRHARIHRNGTGCVNPAQGLLVREQQCSGCTDPSESSDSPVHNLI